MISNIKIQNFKSIGPKEVSLELKPLTLLVGPNGSGKSSIIEAITVAAQGGSLQGEMFNVPPHEALFQQQESGDMVITVMFTQDIGYQFISKFANGALIGNSGAEVGSRGKGTEKLNSELIGRYFPLSSVRGNVPTETQTNRNITWVGVHGERLLDVLAVIYGQRTHDKAAAQITYWANKFGLTGLKAGFWGSNRLSADYRDNALKTSLRLALASSGARQVLTVISQLFWSPPQSIIAIEEPEISLHPKAQIDISALYSDVLKAGKQIIATTHSSLMLLAIMSAIQKQLLRAEDVVIYHVEKRRGTGTLVKNLPINKQGRTNRWIPSFAKEERRLLQEWLNILPEK